MLIRVDLLLRHLFGDLDGDIGDLRFHLIEYLPALLADVGVRLGGDGLGLLPRGIENVALLAVGKLGRLADDLVALLLRLSDLLVVGELGVDHSFHRLEQELFKDQECDKHIAQRKQSRPEIYAHNAFKILQLFVLLCSV